MWICGYVDMCRDVLPSHVLLMRSWRSQGIKGLEERIVSFTLGKTDVLIATTILENGIDIPNVNTIIVQVCARVCVCAARGLGMGRPHPST